MKRKISQKVFYFLLFLCVLLVCGLSLSLSLSISTCYKIRAGLPVLPPPPPLLSMPRPPHIFSEICIPRGAVHLICTENVRTKFGKSVNIHQTIDVTWLRDLHEILHIIECKHEIVHSHAHTAHTHTHIRVSTQFGRMSASHRIQFQIRRIAFCACLADVYCLLLTHLPIPPLIPRAHCLFFIKLQIETQQFIQQWFCVYREINNITAGRHTHTHTDTWFMS